MTTTNADDNHHVIPSQCAHWRGNLVEVPTKDCHTSDIGHWFAMTEGGSGTLANHYALRIVSDKSQSFFAFIFQRKHFFFANLFSKDPGMIGGTAE